MVPDELNVYLWRDGFHLFFPMRGNDHWRVVGILPPHLRERDDLDVRGRGSLGAPGSGHRARVQGVQLVLDLPHPSPARRALPRSPLLPARRRRAHPQPGRRAGHEHRPAGRVQPRVEARARRVRAAPTPRCSTPTRTSACRSRAAARHDRPGVFADRLRPLARRARSARRSSRRSPPSRCASSGSASSPFRTISQIGIRYPREPAVADAVRACPHAAPRAGDRFPWLRLRLAPNGPVEDLFDAARRHAFQPDRVRAGVASGRH